MAGASLTATLDLDGIRRTLDALAGIGRDPTPLMRAIGTGMAHNVRDRFAAQQDPWGRAWLPLQPAYAALKKGSRILTESGMLSGSITITTSGHTVTIGTNRIYGGVHQFGAGVRKAHASSVRIPARPYLGFGIADVDTTMDAAEGVLAWAVQQGGGH